MKVLQIIDSLPNTSGGARFVVNLTKQLLNRNIMCDVLLIDGKKSHFFDELNAIGANVIILDKNQRSRYRVKYAIQISKFMKNYDIVHVHVFPASYLVAFATFFSKHQSVVFTEHSSFNKRAAHRFFRNVERQVYGRFQIIVCLSEQVFAFIRKNLNTSELKLRIIENAVDGDAVSQAVPYSKEVLGFKQDDFLVLMSSRLDPDKRHDVLIESLKLLDDNVKLLFAGDGPTKKELQQLVKDSNLCERVFFLGARQDIFRLMKSVDINILASNFEGLSLAALEAMSAGKPFIASNVEGLDFVVQEARLLFENNPVSAANKIRLLYMDRVWRKNAAEISIQRSKDFDIKRMTDKYIKVYEDILKK